MPIRAHRLPDSGRPGQAGVPTLVRPVARWTTPAGVRPGRRPTAAPWRCRITLRDDQVRLRLPPGGGAGRRHAKNAARPMNQSREAHHAARPHHSPEGGHEPHASGGPAATPGSRGLSAPERCASRRLRRSRASVRAAISWSRRGHRPCRMVRSHTSVRAHWRRIRPRCSQTPADARCRAGGRPAGASVRWIGLGSRRRRASGGHRFAAVEPDAGGEYLAEPVGSQCLADLATSGG